MQKRGCTLKRKIHKGNLHSVKLIKTHYAMSSIEIISFNLIATLNCQYVLIFHKMGGKSFEKLRTLATVTEYDSKAFHPNLHGNNHCCQFCFRHVVRRKMKNEEETWALREACRNSTLDGRNICFECGVGMPSSKGQRGDQNLAAKREAFFSLFFFFGRTVRGMATSPNTDQTAPLQWKLRASTAGLPGKPRSILFK